ncbi:MAG: MerR family transcriptional regulator [Ilumatobacteraceae bacterium]|nr:MerR family transcriptional regulator [Ilumatobacteraceae bacterium]
MLVDTGPLLSIGDFARATNLTIKTLRHYHSVGLLAPVDVNAANGYRSYAVEQIPLAQVIRRLRDLDMPIDDVRAVVVAPDVEARNVLIAHHLSRLERQLRETRSHVDSLRDLLDPSAGSSAIVHRSVPVTLALAVSGDVTRTGLGTWWTSSMRAILARADAAGVRCTGALGGMYAAGLFEDEGGACTLFLPIEHPRDGVVEGAGDVECILVPAAELAVIEHSGSHRNVDLSYGALGAHVARHALGVEGPLREHYVVGPSDTSDESAWVTEICWPIFRTATSDATSVGSAAASARQDGYLAR